MPRKVEVEEGIETLCYLPDAAQSAASIREQLAEALKRGLKPRAVPRTAVRRTVMLSAEMSASLRELGTQQIPQASVGKTVCGLLVAFAEVANRARESGPLAKALSQAELRPEQETVLTQALPLLRSGHLVMSEVGTGLGKSRIAGVVADIMLRERNQAAERVVIPEEDRLGKVSGYATRAAARAVKVVATREEEDASLARTAVIVAAPTVSNIVHLASEFESLVPSGFMRNALVRVVLGRGQFVSPSRVSVVTESLLSNSEGLSDEDKKRLLNVQRWVKKGMPSGQSDATRDLARFHAQLFGLLDDLKHLAPEDFPIDDVVLVDDDDEVEAEAYHAAREDLFDADIVLTTHHTLCWDNIQLLRDAPPILPKARCLIVDEAHLLEATQSAVASSALSFFALRIALRQEPGGSSLADAVQTLALQLQRIGEELPLPADTTTGNGRNWAKAQIALTMLGDDIEAFLSKKRGGKKRDLDIDARRRRLVIQRALQVIRAINTGANGRLQFSPDLRYPSILCGRGSVANFLAARWAVVDCALLLSGTLLIPSAQGLTPHMMLGRLALDPERAAVTTPVHAAWTFETPTVYIPSAEIAPSLAPPAPPFTREGSLRGWATNIAQVIEQHVAPTAKGGTLVLVSGFERVSLIAESLQDGLNGRLIVHDNRRSKLIAAKRAFEEMRAFGKRPVWVATGGAWTGLDLADAAVDPEEDLLLTDLVIASLPYGMARNLSHQVRVDYRGFVAEKEQMLLTFIQGLGRLIRRPSLKHRRIWVLDGRLRLPTTRNTSAEALSHLQRYPKLREFGG